jgi:hypothetical protein
MNQVQAVNHQALARTKFTPDIAELELSQFQLVFLCDDLMLAGRKYDLIREHSAFVTRAFTKREYQFFKKSTDGSAVIVNASQKMQTGNLRVKGELHCILSTRIPELDTHYQNGVSFQRYRTPLLRAATPVAIAQDVDVDGNGHKKVFHLPEVIDPLEAWMYIGLRSYWDDLLDGGFAFEPVRIAEPEKERDWLPRYYHWINKS